MRRGCRTTRRQPCYGSPKLTLRLFKPKGQSAEDIMTDRNKPPFRADHVGSILRTAPVKEARAKREKGAINAAQLKEVEDREIEKIIRKQEEIGLKLATDGEFRRSWWHFDFFGMLDG